MQGHQTPARLAAVFAAMTAAGLSKSDIARIAGVHRSQVSRWFTGETRPTYDTAMRLAAGIRPVHPELADEFVSAAGYGGPGEPAPGPTPLDDEIGADLAEKLRRRIRAQKGEHADWYISAVGNLLGRPPEDAGQSPERDARPGRREG